MAGPQDRKDDFVDAESGRGKKAAARAAAEGHAADAGEGAGRDAGKSSAGKASAEKAGRSGKGSAGKSSVGKASAGAKGAAGTSAVGSAEAPAGTEAPAGAADIGVIGMLRWAWRQLTTMRVALMLLLLLSVAAVPGSLFPQRIQDPTLVTQYIQDNGAVAEWMDRLQLFDVYGSIWFSAIYILLMVSLVGCILPRTKVHWQAMRAAPPKAPRRFSRMPAHRSDELDADAEDILDEAEAVLKSGGYRTERRGDHVAAERGYLRETGNLVFHAALLGVVVSVATGSLLGWSGQRILVEGDTFTNSLVSYDSFNAGTYYNADDLDPFRLHLEEFRVTFDSQAEGNQFGQPRSFEADMLVSDGEDEHRETLMVNEPIRLHGDRIYLVGNGYAPEITVRDATGEVAFSGPTVFLPQDGVYTSRGVVKVTDSQPDQLGLIGVLLPTAGQNAETGEVESQFADLVNPYLVLNAYVGDLGVDDGIPRSVYSLDPEGMEELLDPETGEPLTIGLQPGESANLPDGRGSVTFDGVKRYIALDIRHDPVQGAVLVFSALAFLGLGASLFVPRRRAWIRVTGGGGEGPATVEIAALARGDDPRLTPEVDRLAVELQGRVA